MSKFKEYRQARGYTQENVAEMLKTTQQTVARWETGKAEPSLAHLKDLAVIYGTSVDDLLGRNPLSTAVVTNSYFSLDGGREHFWGHLGVRLPTDKFTRWFPITMARADYVDRAIAMADTDKPWIVVPTLNNRLLLINVPQVQYVYMLDDDADQVGGDWELGWDSYQGHSIDVYRALASRAYGELDEDEYSESFRLGLEDLIKEQELDEDAIRERVLETVVHFQNGTERRGTPDADGLWAAVVDAEHSSPSDLVFDLSEPDIGLTVYIPTSSVRMVDMPLYQVMDAARSEMGELQAEAAAAKAVKKAQGHVDPKRGRPRKA
jgi:transcriptional regulator with XRE-family HTH domain